MYYALSRLIGYAIKKLNAGIKSLMHADHYKKYREVQLYDVSYSQIEDLRVAYEDLETKGFDAGGGEILYYKGRPFTGTIVEYRDGVLVGEEEFKTAIWEGRKGVTIKTVNCRRRNLLPLISRTDFVVNGMRMVSSRLSTILGQNLD